MLILREHDNLASGRLDLSSVPKESLNDVISLAYQKAKASNDDEAVRDILFYQKDWDALLQRALEKISSPDESIQKKGLKALWPLVHSNQPIPKDLAERLVDLTIEETPDLGWYTLRAPLYFGSAKEKSVDLGRKLLSEGDFENGLIFMQIGEQEPTKKELRAYAKIAQKNGKVDAALSFYQYMSLYLSPQRARKIIHLARNNDNQAIGKKVIDETFEYMETMNRTLEPSDYKEQGDEYFAKKSFGGPHDALKYYKKAGKEITAEEYFAKGKIVLQSITYEENLYSLAYEYLKKGDKNKAITVMEEAAAGQIKEHPHWVKKIYNVINKKIPEDVAMKAANETMQKGWFDDAAEYCVAAGHISEASTMGYLALGLIVTDRNNKKFHDNDLLIYRAKNCFKLANDAEGMKQAEFYEKNYSRR